MSKKRILIQLDSDPQASTFDSVVAVDAGVEQLLTRSNVSEDQVEGLTHGAMFTRGPDDLKSTAIFVGGSDVTVAESLLNRITKCFFGPMRVSVMMDANGANTTASAAVIAAARHVDLSTARFGVLAATGPVGQRVVQLLAKAGAEVTACSRKEARAKEACDAINEKLGDAKLTAAEVNDDKQAAAVLRRVDGVIAAGAAGIQLLSKSVWEQLDDLKVMIDLNAVEPAGIEGLSVMDQGQAYGATIGYGAIGVGGTKMKIHKEAIRQLFESNDKVFDAEQLFDLGMQLESA